MKVILYIIEASFLFLISCVPARKYESLQSDYNKCSDSLSLMTAKNKDLESNLELMSKEVEKAKLDKVQLTKDTALLGSSLRRKEIQYDKINELNYRIQKQLESLQKGSAIQNQQLTDDLNNTKLILQMKETELNSLSAELTEKKTLLDKLSIELERREKKVKDLEALIAEKDKKVNVLQQQISKALFGFKDKGLSVENRNGKVYVSMEAKLLFASGSTKIDSEGRKALIELAKILEAQNELEILVEGHTDSDPLKSSSHPKSNWELSVLRATSVVELMLANSNIDKTKVIAAGRGEFLPLNSLEKSKNRRIEIILSPKLDELYNILAP